MSCDITPRIGNEHVGKAGNLGLFQSGNSLLAHGHANQLVHLKIRPSKPTVPAAAEQLYSCAAMLPKLFNKGAI